LFIYKALRVCFGGALFGAWGKWSGGKEGAASVFKDTNDSGQRGRGGSGAVRVRGMAAVRQRHHDGGGGGAA